jgi:hypothetical protein
MQLPKGLLGGLAELERLAGIGQECEFLQN